MSVFHITANQYTLIFINLILLSKILATVSDNGCSTPEEWMEVLRDGFSSESSSTEGYFPSGESGSEELIHAGAQMWPGGVVKYEFDSSLNEHDRYAVQQAFDEYHSKTCIRFHQWNRDSSYYTRIISNSSYCGLGTVCYNWNNFAIFGGGCRNKATMVHELGHNLCLSHEHQRHDRDDYLSFQPYSSFCPITSHNFMKFTNSFAPLFYDYASQMHYCCAPNCCMVPKQRNVPGCGYNQHDGLSVLDADMLNDMYKCSNCLRHRWKSIHNADLTTLHNFGFVISEKSNISPCRSNVGDGKEIAVGTYHHNRRVCKLTFNGQIFEKRSYFEVLVVPHGLQHEGKYEFVERHNIPRYNIVSKAVPGGYTLGPYQVQYIALLQHKDGSASFGKADASNGQLTTAKFPGDRQEITTNDFLVLICSNDGHYFPTVKPTLYSSTTKTPEYTHLPVISTNPFLCQNKRLTSVDSSSSSVSRSTSSSSGSHEQSVSDEDSAATDENFAAEQDSLSESDEDCIFFSPGSNSESRSIPGEPESVERSIDSNLATSESGGNDISDGRNNGYTHELKRSEESDTAEVDDSTNRETREDSSDHAESIGRESVEFSST